MKSALLASIAAATTFLAMSSVLAVPPVQTPAERARMRAWIAESMRVPVRPPATADADSSPLPSLVVRRNLDRVATNRRPDGVPIKIGKAAFERGILCHAPSRIVARLPGPGKVFRSLVGIHADAGGGTVVFSVAVRGEESFRSGVLRCGDEAVPVEVDLAGATELSLEVGDAGDGISCDQSDWADARAILADGREVWLGDLPVVAADIRARGSPAPPFSFMYGGRWSDDILGGWRLRQEREARGGTDVLTRTFLDPDTGLEVTWSTVEYLDFPTVEWTLRFRNAGREDTPVLEGIRPLDIGFERDDSESEFLLHHNVGSLTSPRDYAPLRTPLGPARALTIGSFGGRPLNTDMPYFNVRWGDRGAIVALGWPGQWSSAFIRDASRGLRLVAGQDATRFRLRPGEEARTPLVVLQLWEGGDLVRSQNIWRRWMVAHNLPRPGGRLLGPVLSGAVPEPSPGFICGQDDEIPILEDYVRRGLAPDYWWRDAGWYPCGGQWPVTGTWEPDPVRYPGGLRAVADRVHAAGMRFLVWFEPERVVAGTRLAREHPEWILGGANGGLLDLGNAEAWSWLVDHIDRLLTTQGIDMYRQDFNMDPLGHWIANDAEDRRGLTENHHVEGLLRFWDELRRRHPEMPIDCCASGGRRNDLELMRRGLPLSKSDHAGGTTSTQCQTYGIASWLPYFGAGVGASEDLHVLRSNMAPWIGACWDARKDDLDYDRIRGFLAEWRRVAVSYRGDFYPLTEYSLAEDVWMAWQFHGGEERQGAVQAFRRAESPQEVAVYRLRGLEPDASYVVTDLDGGAARRIGGAELMEPGLRIEVPKRPWAKTILYEEIE